ncbi:zinc finger protein 593 homolog [Coccinella septempunctata]|uniref:zinc finger protein 593 homolog n=1 Tax=Coccinella septempunctata TaxID=41139 RepID=UPI001D093F5D|nr:zinc finger protein 593 homolog [Coccinella septempunctata]
MTRQRRKKMHFGDTHLKKKWRTKRRTKDLDEINEDIKPENCEKLLNQEVDYDKPGSAQHYCVHCARYFISQNALQDHFRTKTHKRRLKALETEPYTIEESERAAGIGSWVQPVKRKIETQKPLKPEDTVEPTEKRARIDID